MHTLIVGISFSGKTNLCKRFATSHENVIVFDPIKSSGWPTTSEKFASPTLFLDRVETAQNAHIFVDEAKILWDADTPRANKLLYSRRHQGLLIYLIAQRTRMIPPNGRNQCSKVFAFKQQLDDANILAAEYAPEFLNCQSLAENCFIGSNGFTTKYYQLDYSQVTSPLTPPQIISKITE